MLKIVSVAGDEDATDCQRYSGNAQVLRANAHPLGAQGCKVACGVCTLVQKVDLDKVGYRTVQARIRRDQPLWGCCPADHGQPAA